MWSNIFASESAEGQHVKNHFYKKDACNKAHLLFLDFPSSYPVSDNVDIVENGSYLRLKGPSFNQAKYGILLAD